MNEETKLYLKQIMSLTNYAQTDELTKEILGDKYEEYIESIKKLLDRIIEVHFGDEE